LLGASNWFSLVPPFPNSLGAGFWLVVLRGCSWEFRAGVYAGGLCVWVVFLAGHYAFFLWIGLISSGISAMELFGGVEVLFSLDFGGGFVGAGGGEEKKVLRGDRPEHSVFRLACVNVGDSWVSLVIMTSSNPSGKGLNF